MGTPGGPGGWRNGRCFWNARPSVWYAAPPPPETSMAGSAVAPRSALSPSRVEVLAALAIPKALGSAPERSSPPHVSQTSAIRHKEVRAGRELEGPVHPGQAPLGVGSAFQPTSFPRSGSVTLLQWAPRRAAAHGNGRSTGRPR